MPPVVGRLPGNFAIASRDELWMRGALLESRLIRGEARWIKGMIEASDARDDRLAGLCDSALGDARATLVALAEARVRVVVRASREDDVVVVETTITITIDGLSVVTTPADAWTDYALLRGLAGSKAPAAIEPLPIVWLNGSAAVLLHEAYGHAEEHGAPPVEWPPWLSIEAPLAERRETFRDLPLPRMTHLIARPNAAPFEMPEKRIEVQLIAGGGFDPVTDIVTIDVAASTAGPFTIRRLRAQIAASLAGAAGEPLRYPGVICSREGQQLYVASHAPVMITDALI